MNGSNREGEGAACYDCGRRYGDEHGFPDLVVPHDVWARISPKGNEGGLLCPSCMAERCYRLGIECRAKWTSGPFVCDQEPTPLLVTAADVALLQWIIDDEQGDWMRHRRSVMSWHHVEAVSNLRDRISRALTPDASVPDTAQP